MTKLERKVLSWEITKSLIQATKGMVLPGFQGVPLYEIVKFFAKEVKNIKLSERAAAVTYNFLMAMPPTFLFLFSLVPYLPLKDVQQTILTTLMFITPNNHAYDVFSKVVIDFMNTQHKDVLSVGVLLALFFSSNGIMGLMRSFDRSLDIYKKRSGLSRRWTAIKLTFVLICMAIASLAALIVQSEILNVWILRIFNNILAVKIVSFMILVLIVFCAISIIYAYGPSLTHRFEFVSAGSVFATILSILATFVFFFLVNNILNYNKVYGSIGSVIAFMVWVWINTLIILIGYELNVGILLGKISRTKNVISRKKNP